MSLTVSELAADRFEVALVPHTLAVTTLKHLVPGDRVHLEVDVLAKYVGTYQELDNWGPGPHPRIIRISVSDGTLVAELEGRGKAQLLAQSDTRFSGFFGLGISFVLDSQGVLTHLLEMHVSGNYRFSRMK